MTDTKEVVKEIAKDVYNDAGKSIVNQQVNCLDLFLEQLKQH